MEYTNTEIFLFVANLNASETEFKTLVSKLGAACVPLDLLDCGHVSTLGHMSVSWRVQWQLPLDKNPFLPSSDLREREIKRDHKTLKSKTTTIPMWKVFLDFGKWIDRKLGNLRKFSGYKYFFFLWKINIFIY